MEKIKLIFIGTDKIGVPLLAALHQDGRFEVGLTVTQIDKPAGRKMELTAPPVKEKAHELGLEVFQPENINSEDSLLKIREQAPDMIVLMAYGQILSKKLLDIPEYGCINVHASILPKHRGASPVQQSLLHQDETTGISVMRMAEKMDAGPVFATSKIMIEEWDDAVSLADKLAKLSAEKVPGILDEIVNADLKAEPQDHSSATYCQKIHKNDGHLDWNESADTLAAKIRAFAGWPGTFCFWDQKRVKILKAKPSDKPMTDVPGTVFMDGGIYVACKAGALELEELQMEGKKPQLIDDFFRGYPDFMGSKLE